METSRALEILEAAEWNNEVGRICWFAANRMPRLLEVQPIGVGDSWSAFGPGVPAVGMPEVADVSLESDGAVGEADHGLED